MIRSKIHEQFARRCVRNKNARYLSGRAPKSAEGDFAILKYMSIFTRFFGKSEADDVGGGRLVANPAIEHPLSLQVLFPEPSRLDSGRLAEGFKTFHRSMSDVRCEFEPQLNREGTVLGMAGWEKHVIRFVGFNLPMPSEAVEQCVAPAHYSQELKARVRAHKAHVILYYAGFDSSPLEQYVALAATAGVLSQFGAIVVLNESGHTSFPVAALSSSTSKEDALDLLRSLPLPILYCGFVKHEVKDVLGVWMRTYGAGLLGLPDLAAHAQGHHEGQRYFDIFENVLSYLRTSGARLAPGHTMELHEEKFLRVRLPNKEEGFLSSDRELLVAEIIGADEINR